MLVACYYAGPAARPDLLGTPHPLRECQVQACRHDWRPSMRRRAPRPFRSGREAEALSEKRPHHGGGRPGEWCRPRGASIEALGTGPRWGPDDVVGRRGIAPCTQPHRGAAECDKAAKRVVRGKAAVYTTTGLDRQLGERDRAAVVGLSDDRRADDGQRTDKDSGNRPPHDNRLDSEMHLLAVYG